MQGVRHGVALALTAVSYNLCHHLGLLPDGLGEAGRGTRVADWLDLAVPFLVLAPALLALVAARPDRTTWATFAAGAVVYTEGHGIHLAANSIGNVSPGPTAHLWDETAGHLIWYAGTAVVLVALARTLHDRPVVPAAFVLAGASGLTWATNALGADLALVGAGPAVVALVWGARHRSDQRVLVAVAGLVALLTLVVAVVLGEA